MTEIPEHLLKRSRDRRATLTGDSGAAAAPGPSAPSAASSPATTSAPAAPASTAPAGRAAAPAPAGPPPPKPDSFVVQAFKRRKRIPFWAMLALSLLPVWAFMYARAVTTQAKEAAGPLGVGEEVYAGCASCHGGSGEGVSGLGYPFTDGEVLQTFPHIEDQLRYVYFGTAGYNAAGVEIYGNPEREGGPHITGARNVMPAQAGNITDAEILAVVCHERYTLGGADSSGELAEEFEEFCSEESELFAGLEEGGDLREVIGNEPVPGLAPGQEPGA